MHNADNIVDAQLKKSISEHDECVTKATEIRQKQRAELVTLTVHGADATELSKFAITRPSRFHAPKSHKVAPKVDPSSEDRIDVNLGGLERDEQQALFQVSEEHHRSMTLLTVELSLESLSAHRLDVLTREHLQLRIAELSRAEAQEALESTGKLNAKAASAIHAESSDFVLNIDAHMRANRSLGEKSVAGSSFTATDSSAIRKPALNSHRVSDEDRPKLLFLLPDSVRQEYTSQSGDTSGIPETVEGRDVG